MPIPSWAKRYAKSLPEQVTVIHNNKPKEQNDDAMMPISAPGQPKVSFTGYGEDGKLQPDMPVDMVSTTEGDAMLHEGEIKIEGPDGRVTVIPAKDLPQDVLKKVEERGLCKGGSYKKSGYMGGGEYKKMKGYQSGGEFTIAPPPPPTFNFGGNNEEEEKNIPEGGFANWGDDPGQTTIDTPSKEEPAGQPIIETPPQKIEADPFSIDLEPPQTITEPPPEKVEADTTTVDSTIDRGIGYETPDRGLPEPVKEVTKPPDAPTDFMPPPPPAPDEPPAPPPPPAPDELIAGVQPDPVTEKEAEEVIAKQPLTKEQSAFAQGMESAFKQLQGIASGMSNVDKMIANRYLAEYDARSAASNRATMQRMASDPNMSAGAKRAMMFQLERDANIGRSKLVGELAVNAAQRAENAAKDVFNKAYTAEQFAFQKQQYDDRQKDTDWARALQYYDPSTPQGLKTLQDMYVEKFGGPPPDMNVLKEERDYYQTKRNQDVVSGQIQIDRAFERLGAETFQNIMEKINNNVPYSAEQFPGVSEAEYNAMKADRDYMNQKNQQSLAMGRIAIDSAWEKLGADKFKNYMDKISNNVPYSAEQFPGITQEEYNAMRTDRDYANIRQEQQITAGDIANDAAALGVTTQRMQAIINDINNGVPLNVINNTYGTSLTESDYKSMGAKYKAQLTQMDLATQAAKVNLSTAQYNQATNLINQGYDLAAVNEMLSDQGAGFSLTPDQFKGVQTVYRQNVLAGDIANEAAKLNVSGVQMEQIIMAVNNGVPREEINSQYGVNISDDAYKSMAARYAQGITAGDIANQVAAESLFQMQDKYRDDEKWRDYDRLLEVGDISGAAGVFEAITGYRPDMAELESVQNYNQRIRESDLHMVENKIGQANADLVQDLINKGYSPYMVNKALKEAGVDQISIEDYNSILDATPLGERNWGRNMAAANMLLSTPGAGNKERAADLYNEMFPGMVDPDTGEGIDFSTLITDENSQRFSEGMAQMADYVTSGMDWDEALNAMKADGTLDKMGWTGDYVANLNTQIDSVISGLPAGIQSIAEKAIAQFRQPKEGETPEQHLKRVTAALKAAGVPQDQIDSIKLEVGTDTGLRNAEALFNAMNVNVIDEELDVFMQSETLTDEQKEDIKAMYVAKLSGEMDWDIVDEYEIRDADGNVLKTVVGLEAAQKEAANTGGSYHETGNVRVLPRNVLTGATPGTTNVPESPKDKTPDQRVAAFDNFMSTVPPEKSTGLSQTALETLVNDGIVGIDDNGNYDLKSYEDWYDNKGGKLLLSKYDEIVANEAFFNKEDDKNLFTFPEQKQIYKMIVDGNMPSNIVDMVSIDDSKFPPENLSEWAFANKGKIGYFTGVAAISSLNPKNEVISEPAPILFWKKKGDKVYGVGMHDGREYFIEEGNVYAINEMPEVAPAPPDDKTDIPPEF